MYDTLLFLHVFAAFLLGAAVVMSSAFALGAQATDRMIFVSDRLEDVGALGTLVLGIWLALYVDGYSLGDGWILGALGLWALSSYFSFALRPGFPMAERSRFMHWGRTLAVLGILVLMVWKPGA